ncbi:transcriptional regulator [Alphaproteobacteria bacterium]|nr:transcriptional regulator [Alphaproteobacteria bacterium]GHS96283.1 transcriptional regulator [Alphaproteobacteria bacterium]
MNKGELITSVSTKSGLSKVDSEKAIDAVFDSITDALKDGDEVRMVGFGTFVCVDKPASEGRNPRTGEKIKIKARRVPKFKPGKQLKESV